MSRGRFGAARRSSGWIGATVAVTRSSSSPASGGPSRCCQIPTACPETHTASRVCRLRLYSTTEGTSSNECSVRRRQPPSFRPSPTPAVVRESTKRPIARAYGSGLSGRLAPRRRRDRRHTRLCRSHNPRWSRLPDGRLPLRQELHKLGTAVGSLLVRTTAGRDAGDCRILTAMRGWLNCLRRCRRQRRALDCCGRVRRPFGVATAWLPDVLDSHTARKEEVGRRGLPSRIVGREKGGLGLDTRRGYAEAAHSLARSTQATFVGRGVRPLIEARGAIASRVRLTPQAAAAPSAPTEAPPWPLPTVALGRRRSPAWPRS